MKQIFKWLLTGVTVGLAIGYFTTKHLLTRTIPKGYVHATIKNKSGFNIKSIFLKYRGGNIEIKDIDNNEEQNLFFNSGGENAYNIIAIFDNDSTVTSKGMYVEGGYKTIETIFTDYIKTEYDN